MYNKKELTVLLQIQYLENYDYTIIDQEFKIQSCNLISLYTFKKSISHKKYFIFRAN